MINDGKSIKGRGAQYQADNRFNKANYVRSEAEAIDLEAELNGRTTYIEVKPKSIVNKVDSPDLSINYSLNPYQGCEHGCIYCYARNSHMYWGYEPGIDFESKILVKKDAAKLLTAFFMKPSWRGEAIALSGNTDCYQPIEKKLKISRSIIEVCLKFQNPIGIITKNNLVCRDIDLLKEMATKDLVHVFISLTTLDKRLHSKMEPRTSAPKKRLETIQKLSEANIPVGVMLAPIIPGLNSHEIPSLAKAAAEAGAKSLGHTTIRLNGSIAGLFEDWINKHFPDRSNKVLSQIKQMHGGKLNDSTYGRRMKGSGAIASMIKQMMKQSESRFFKHQALPKYNNSIFFRPGQTLNIQGLD